MLHCPGTNFIAVAVINTIFRIGITTLFISSILPASGSFSDFRSVPRLVLQSGLPQLNNGRMGLCSNICESVLHNTKSTSQIFACTCIPRHYRHHLRLRSPDTGVVISNWLKFINPSTMIVHYYICESLPISSLNIFPSLRLNHLHPAPHSFPVCARSPVQTPDRTLRSVSGESPLPEPVHRHHRRQTR